jgi:tetratricopeptide (TPR) repeat protein
MNTQQLMMQANARFKAGDRAGALEDYATILRADPKAVEAFLGRGAARFALGDANGAIADYTQALQLDPTSVRAYFNRAVALRSKGDVQGAIADYNAAIRLNANEAILYNNRGNLYFETGDLDRAMADCNDAIRLNPKQASAFFIRGAAYEAKKDFARARVDYQQALALKPDHPKAASIKDKIAAWVLPDPLVDLDDDPFGPSVIQPFPPKPQPSVNPLAIVPLPPINPLAGTPAPVRGRSVRNLGNMPLIGEEPAKDNGDLLMGIVGGAIGALIGAVIWAVITAVTGWELGIVAIAIGFLTGYGVRVMGKSEDFTFGFVGAILALIGCVLGNFMAAYFIAQSYVIAHKLHVTLTPALVLKIMGETFTPIDLVFYGIALYEGFKFSVISKRAPARSAKRVGSY